MEAETIACAVLIAPKVTEHYGNDSIGTRMGSPSGTSSFLLLEIKAMLEKSSFKTESEAAAHVYEAAETLIVQCEKEMNEVPYTKFSYLFPKGMEGALPTNVTFVFY